jgi:predicted DNA-binding transcriptional regulator AlpA
MDLAVSLSPTEATGELCEALGVSRATLHRVLNPPEMPAEAPVVVRVSPGSIVK